MLKLIMVVIRFVILVFGGQKQVRLGKRRTASAVGCFQTRCEETKTASPRPIVLDWAEDDLEGVEIGAGDR